MKVQKETATIAGVGAAACAICCAGPIVGLLAAIGIGTAAGFALFGTIAAVIGTFFVTMVLVQRRRRRRAATCAPADAIAIAAPRRVQGTITYVWRAPFSNGEIHALHAAAFETRLFDESEWDWVAQTNRYSLGWVVARDDDRFVGFVNVLWDGLVHAFIEDVMVDDDYRHRGIGVGIVHAARDGARGAGCEFLHVGVKS